MPGSLPERSIHSPAIIGHILPFQGIGGTEMATLRVARAAREFGYQSVLFCPSAAHEVQEFCRAEFPVECYEPVDYSFRHPLPAIVAARSMAAQFRRLRLDLIHCSDIRAAYLAGLAGRLAGIPMICHVRNRYRELPWREKLPLFLIRHFVFVSQNTWDTFCLKVPPGKGTVLYDGLAAVGTAQGESTEKRRALLDEFNLPDDSFLIGMLARVGPQKDFRTLIQAAATVTRNAPRVRFIVIGDHSGTEAHREHYREVRRWLEETGMSGFFTFTGFRSDAVEQMLPALDVFVLCTHWEGFPLAIIEAMSRGIPVAATDVDGIPEVVKEGATGLLHPHEDSEALARQLLRLISDPELTRRLAQNGRETIARRFSLESFTASVGRLYDSILNPPPRSAAETK